MLSFRFDLTPAQTKLLLAMAFGHYHRSDPQAPLLPCNDSPLFITISKGLVKRGLATHDPRREPTWMPTAQGITIAEMIADDAAEIVKQRKTRKPIPKAARRS